MLIKANYYSLFPRRFIAGTRNSYGIETLGFEFSPEWDGLGKTVTFYPVSGAPVAVVYGDSPITIPAEVMAHSGLAKFTLSGKHNEKTLVSVTGYIDVLDALDPDGDLPVTPTASEMAQVLTLMNTAVETASSVRADADNGVFNGAGVPSGGTKGQVLVKISDSDLDAKWGYDSGKLYIIHYFSSNAPSLWSPPNVEGTLYRHDHFYGIWYDVDSSDGNGVGWKLCRYEGASGAWSFFRNIAVGDLLLFADSCTQPNYEASVDFYAGQIWECVNVYNESGGLLGSSLSLRWSSAKARIRAFESVTSVKLAHNGEYRQLASPSSSSIFKLTLPAIANASSDFRATVIYTASSALPPTVVNGSGYELRYSGKSVSNNVFTPVAGTRYKIVFEFDGLYVNVNVS